jgi:5-(carboxyamino)imidazole ribonucleotide mutase
MKMPKVAVFVGSKSDEAVGTDIVGLLKEYTVETEYRIISAHRNPDELDAFVKNSGAEVFVAVAGLSAALPGVIASKTVRAVIGVPREVKLGGLDALLSIVQMPPGIPVASVGIENWKNAAILAIEILSLKYPELATKLKETRKGK